MMNPRTLFLILGAVALSATGQLLLKAGAMRARSDGTLGFLGGALTEAHTLLGLAAWIASTVLWLYVLRVLPVSRAYGLTSLTYVLVFLGGVALFGEQVRPVHAMGTLLIVVGIGCLMQG